MTMNMRDLHGVQNGFAYGTGADLSGLRQAPVIRDAQPTLSSAADAGTTTLLARVADACAVAGEWFVTVSPSLTLRAKQANPSECTRLPGAKAALAQPVRALQVNPGTGVILV